MIFVKYLLLLSLIVVIFLLITLVTITRPDNQESFTMNLDASFPFELHELLELPMDAGPTELKLETIEKEFRFSLDHPVSQKVFDTNKVYMVRQIEKQLRNFVGIKHEHSVDFTLSENVIVMKVKLENITQLEASVIEGKVEAVKNMRLELSDGETIITGLKMDVKSGGELPFDFRESLDSKRAPMPLKSASPDSDSPMIHQGKPCNTYAELEDVNTPPDMSRRVFMNYRMDIDYSDV
tara:strand:+ start:98 stop:811 length:714 start_codon:yes stop_codon:yes gene_type:complete